jgi:outer membrane protein TolC
MAHPQRAALNDHKVLAAARSAVTATRANIDLAILARRPT